MTSSVEVFADIGCPFTHVGLRLVANRLEELRSQVDCRVRAWPLEWVNGEPMTGEAVAAKVAALRAQLGDMYFTGFDPAAFPGTTIPALNLAASAYERSAAVGLSVSLELRDALFERGEDVASPAVLATVAERHGLPAPANEADAAVHVDYEDGKQRGVTGSPHFYAGSQEFFCPTLDLGHDDEGNLTASVDVEGLATFIDHLRTL